MTRLIACLFVVALCASSAHADTPLSPSDFAYGAPLAPTGDAALYVTPLPEHVYRTTTRVDLGDVRVFNGRGEVVPHAIRPALTRVEESEQSLELPWFTLKGESSHGPVRVELDAQRGGALLRVLSDVADERDAPRGAYLLDASAVKAAPSRLVLRFADDAGDVWARLLVEGSHDLTEFHELGRGVVASLERDGNRLDVHTLALNEEPSVRYLRVRAVQGSLPPIASVLAVVPHRTSTEPTAPLRVTSARAEEGRFLYDLGGAFPVAAVGLEFAERNTVARVHVRSSAVAKGPFVERVVERFFRLDGAMPIASSPAPLPGAPRDRFYTLEIDARGGGAGSAAPILIADYRPDDLIWVARGDGPYLLAYGSGAVPANQLVVEDLTGFSPEEPTVLVAGKERVLGGRARLSAPLPVQTTPWKSYILWAVLVASALVLVVLGVRLARRAA